MAKIDPRTTDMWLESRKRTAAYQGRPDERIARWVMQSLPGRPTRPNILSLTYQADDVVFGPDLNIYRPDCPVEMLIDLGTPLFFLRVTHPKRWEWGNMQWSVDPTFVTYYERIRAKSSKVWIAGYHVHSPWEAEADYEHVTWQADFFKEATKNHPLDLYALDDEVGEIWKDGRNTIITNTNCARSIRNEMQRFMNLRKHTNGLPVMTLHYSALWYMRKYGSSATYKPGAVNPSDMREYATWLDQANKDPENLQAPAWRAYYPNQYTETFGTPYDLLNKMPTPTGTQESLYMNGCTHGLAILWQALSTAKFPGMDTGVDFNVGYGLGATKADFARRLNLPTEDTTPPPPPPPPPPAEGTVDWEKYRTAAHAAVDQLVDAMKEPAA